MRKLVVAAGAAALMALASPATSAVTFDPSTGTGFVGKGDVQLALGLNNSQIQSTTVTFAYEGTVESEVSWVCTNSKNETTQERTRTTTTTISGIASSTARVKNQITGYNLTGYTDTPLESSTTEGPPLGSCPNGWTSSPPSDPTVIGSTGELTVNGVALTL